jgi:hypothetical protein
MKTEIGLIFIFCCGILFKLLNWPGWTILILISLSLLALSYFPFAFYFFADQEVKKQNILLSIIAGFILSVIPVGILFKILHYPGSSVMLIFGIMSSPILLIVTYILKKRDNKDRSSYYGNMIVRIIVLSILSLSTYIIP